MRPEFAEDAPEPLAREREAQLQSCRQRLRPGQPWSDEDLAAYAWVCELADAGHVGAARLRERVGFLATQARARSEASKAAPDIDALIRWMDEAANAGGRDDAGMDVDTGRQIIRNVAASLRHVRELAGPSPTDGQVVAALLDLNAFRSVTWHRAGEPDDDAVFAFAKARLAAGEPGAEGVLRRAADLGSFEAQDEVFGRSGDPAILGRWLDKERGPAVELAVRELRSADAINERDLLVLTSARYLGLAAGPGAVERAGKEPYAACLLYTLALHRPETDPARWQLLDRAAAAGSRRAQVACYRREPDQKTLCAHLESGGEPAAATALREAGTLQPAEIAILEGTPWGVTIAGALLLPIARARGAEKLIERAAQLGSTEAATELVCARFDRAPDKRAFVEAFIERYPKATSIMQLLHLRLGALLESERFDDAVACYARALGQPAKVTGRFCFDVACLFDRRYRVHRVDDPRRARSWLERGVDAGNAFCLASLLEAVSDPALAMAAARRWPASPFPSQALRTVRGVIESLEPAPRGAGSELEHEFWKAIREGNDPDDFELYLQQFPNGTYAFEARERLRKLGRTVAEAVATRRGDASQAQKWREVLAFMESRT